MRDVSETRMGQVRYTEVMTLPSDQGYALTTLTQNRSLILFVALHPAALLNVIAKSAVFQ